MLDIGMVHQEISRFEVGGVLPCSDIDRAFDDRQIFLASFDMGFALERRVGVESEKIHLQFLDGRKGAEDLDRDSVFSLLEL